MKRLSDSKMMEYYLEKYNIASFFSIDMTPHMQLLAFEKGENVCKSGEIMEYFYFNVKGKMKIYTLMEDGKSLLLRFNKPLSILGDVELFSGFKTRCNVEPLNEAHLIAIPMELVRMKAGDDPTFLKSVVQSLSYRLYTISNATSLNLLYPLSKRFASYVISITCDETDVKRINEIKTSSMTELATLLGTSYRHLNRTIREFIDDGIIKRENGRIIILDYAKLKERAGGHLYE